MRMPVEALDAKHGTLVTKVTSSMKYVANIIVKAGDNVGPLVPFKYSLWS